MCRSSEVPWPEGSLRAPRPLQCQHLSASWLILSLCIFILQLMFVECLCGVVMHPHPQNSWANLETGMAGEAREEVQPPSQQVGLSVTAQVSGGGGGHIRSAPICHVYCPKLPISHHLQAGPGPQTQFWGAFCPWLSWWWDGPFLPQTWNQPNPQDVLVSCQETVFKDYRQDARDSKFSIFKVIKETPVLHETFSSHKHTVQ